MTQVRALLDWLFRDRRTGRMVVVQVPNLPILLWLATIVARGLVERGSTAFEVLGWAGSITLGWWALDELLRGVNPFRRLLGLSGCAVVVAGVIGRL